MDRPWEVIKNLNDVVYRVMYKGRERKVIKRRVEETIVEGTKRQWQ